MFSYRLKKLREDAGLTQGELAKILNLTQSTIAYYENNKKMPTLENAKLIAEIFNTSLDYLMNISIDYISKEREKCLTPSEEILNDINNLSPKSQKDLHVFINFLKFRDKENQCK